MDAFRAIQSEAYNKLSEARVERWSRAYCPRTRYKYCTYNSVEFINALTGNGEVIHTVKVEYEWKPPKCGVCMVFSHVDAETRVPNPKFIYRPTSMSSASNGGVKGNTCKVSTSNKALTSKGGNSFNLSNSHGNLDPKFNNLRTNTRKSIKKVEEDRGSHVDLGDRDTTSFMASSHPKANL
ncbi:hypothetical protein Tco_0747912 [Tanacetum coccineum]|uniref:Uncharacterized protein n=1 Tax=Tanacetum coccineum TaxID=301880 RepID=A0ABQ4YVA1_9ASTR